METKTLQYVLIGKSTFTGNDCMKKFVTAENFTDAVKVKNEYNKDSELFEYRIIGFLEFTPIASELIQIANSSI